MRRRDEPKASPGRPGLDLPSQDLPSPEVLDELLKAFSADTVDTGQMRQIDLTSPEIEELLAPSGETASLAARQESDPHVEVETSVIDVVSSQVSGSTDATDRDVREAPSGVSDGSGGNPQATIETPDAPVEAAADDAVVDTTVVESGADEPVIDEEAPTIAVSTPDASDTSDTSGPLDGASPPEGTTRTIVIDASDDPPDAVYLAAGDPLLGMSAGGSVAEVDDHVPADATGSGTVFIDDHAVEIGETITLADATSSTRIEPRLRQRRIAVKRAAGRKRLRWAVIGGVFVVAIIAGLAVLGSSWFAINKVKVDGVVYANADAVQAVVDELEGTPVLRADTASAEAQLEAIAWVEDARVTTQFPHGATIEIRERAPVASYQGPDGRFRVIDGHGRVLDVLDAEPVDYLLLVGADSPDLEPGQFAPQGYVAAASLAQALTPEIRARAESVAVTADGSDLRLMLADDVEIRFGPARDLVNKLVRLQTLLDEVVGGGYRYLDVSTNEVTRG